MSFKCKCKCKKDHGLSALPALSNEHSHTVCSNYAPHSHISLYSSYYSGPLITPCLWMDGGASTITHTHTHTHNTLLRSCLYTHSHPRTRLEHWMSKLGYRTTYFQTHSQSLSTMLNFYHLNYPSCKIPSHTFHLFPLLACSAPPSLCSRATILSCSRSHRSLASAQSLEQGHNLADKDCGMFGSVFPGLCTQND